MCSLWCIAILSVTRLHSSGMHTAPLLTVSQHALRRGEGARGWVECLPGRVLLGVGWMYLPSGVYLAGGVPAGGWGDGCNCWGVYLPRGWVN